MDIQKIRLQRQLDAVLLFAPEQILAVAGVYAPKSCAIADDHGVVLVSPEGQTEKDGLLLLEYAECGFERVEHAAENLWKIVSLRIASHKRIGYHKDTCPAVLFGGGADGREYIDITADIAEGMLCKDQSFFEKYATVKELNVKAYDRIRREVRSGYTEQELNRIVKEVYVSGTCDQVLYTGDFLSGLRTCEIAGPATGKVIQKGDTVIVDALCACEGIYCDTTRSYFCGEPTPEQVRAYELLCALQEEARPLLRPGTVAGDIYRYVNRRLKEEGFAGLVHHAGHGLGYSWYEEPYFIGDCGTILKENMLVTLEPGIYLPGQFGLRLENNYRVTEDGGVDVFDYKMKLEDFIID